MKDFINGILKYSGNKELNTEEKELIEEGEIESLNDEWTKCKIPKQLKDKYFNRDNEFDRFVNDLSRFSKVNIDDSITVGISSPYLFDLVNTKNNGFSNELKEMLFYKLLEYIIWSKTGILESPAILNIEKEKEIDSKDIMEIVSNVYRYSKCVWIIHPRILEDCVENKEYCMFDMGDSSIMGRPFIVSSELVGIDNKMAFLINLESYNIFKEDYNGLYSLFLPNYVYFNQKTNLFTFQIKMCGCPNITSPIINKIPTKKYNEYIEKTVYPYILSGKNILKK